MHSSPMMGSLKKEKVGEITETKIIKWDLNSEHQRNLEARTVLTIEVGAGTDSCRKCAHSLHESQTPCLHDVAGQRSEPCGTVGPLMRPRKLDPDPP